MRESGTNNRVIVALGLGSVIVLVVMVAGLRDYFFVVRNDVIYDTVLSVDDPRLEAIRTRDTQTLDSYGWVDREKGIVRIPIERAMELEVKEAGNGGQGR